MHRQPIPAAALAQAILGLLIDEHPGLWHVAELDRSLTSSRATGSSTDTEDTIEQLYADGLIHRTGDFVFATRAAHACRALPS
jgi:hypothetical protein